MIFFTYVSLTLGLIGQWLLGLYVARVVLENFSFAFGQNPSVRHSQPLPSQSCSPFASIHSLAELAGLGLVLGVGLTAWSLFIWSFLGFELGRLPSGLLAAMGYLTGGPVLISRLSYRWSDQKLESPIAQESRRELAASRACKALISILFITTLLQTIQTPQKLWDERAIFALKGIVLFEDRSIRSPDLLHPDFVQYHPRYPLLLPLAEQNIYAMLGSVDDRLSKILFTQLYCGLVLTTAGVLRRHLGEARAWFGGLLMASVPVLMPYEYGFICGQADAPTACYHGLSILYLWDSLKHQQRDQTRMGSLLMAGICGALTAFTKDEGIAFLVIDAAILCLLMIGSVRSFDRARQLFLGLVIFTLSTIAILLPWFAHRRFLPMTTEMNYFGRMTTELFIGRINTLRWSIPHLIRRMFWEWRAWGLQWWLMLGAIVGWPLRLFEQSQLLFVLDVAGAISALLVAGMLAPAQLDEHIGGSSHRFLMQIAPVAILFAVTTAFCQGKQHDVGEVR